MSGVNRLGLGFGVEGLWWGLSAGLGAISVVLLKRLVSLLKQPLQRTA